MKTKLFITGTLLLLLSNWLNVKAEKSPIKWGKLLPEDIKMTVCSIDPEAPAVVLCDFGTATVGTRVEFTKHIRIKILKEPALSYATVEIPYRSYDQYDYFSELKAETFNISTDGKIVKSKLKSSKIQDVQLDKRHKKKIFTLPDVKVGSIIEYTYTINSIDLVKLDHWYFQNTIPVLWSEYRINIPRKLDYLVTFQQGRTLDIQEQEDFAKQLQWLYSTRINKVYSDIADKKHVLYESPKKTIKVYLTRGESLRFVMNNMPAIKPNESGSSVADLYPSVKVHLYQADGSFPFYFRTSLAAANEDYDIWDKWQNRYNWRPGFVAYWLPTWDEASQKWLKDEYLGMRLINNFTYKPIIESITSKDSANMLAGIYRYVKENIKWDSSYSMYAVNNFNNVLKKKSGSSGEINLLMISLLRKAGYTVDPVLIRTHELGRIENLYPEKGQFNHVIAQVELNGKIIYLDATGQGNMSDLPQNVQNTDGWLLKPQSYNWVNITNQSTKPENLKQI